MSVVSGLFISIALILSVKLVCVLKKMCCKTTVEDKPDNGG
jgi:hypothetical protein